MRVRIVTDSSTNVPEDYLQRLNIIEVPAVINFGQDSYLYKVEMSLEEFYRRLAPTNGCRPPRSRRRRSFCRRTSGRRTKAQTKSWR